MIYVLVSINILLGFAITSGFYLPVGLIYLAICGLMMTPICDTSVGHFFIGFQMKRWGKNVNRYIFRHKRLLMSVACLTFGMEIGALVALCTQVGAALVITIAILTASGFIFEGYASGMTMGLAYSIARFIVQIASILLIGFDTVAVWIAKLELKILHIDVD